MNDRGPHLSPDHLALGGARSQSNDGPDAHKYLWVGRIVHVDVETMVCSIKFDTGESERHDIPLPAPGGSGPRSWSGSIPERGTRVLCGWKKYSARGGYTPFILAFLTQGILTAREFEPFSAVDPEELESINAEDPDFKNIPGLNLDVVRLRLRKAYSGDYLASSSSGSDILLDRDVLLTNRAGNEFRLRDSDQTSVLQTLNEFTSNAAGYYRRGIIKRNGFNILPDVFGYTANEEEIQQQATEAESKDGIDFFGVGINRSIPPSSPAFKVLLDQGLIRIDSDGNGVPNFPTDPDDGSWHGWPFVVTPDGQRISYITVGDHSENFSQTDWCYTEDRVELRHASNGVMAISEEGDGIQVDKTYPVFIEDVKGTVVGNDPHSEAGRVLYKQIMKMRLFDEQDQTAPSPAPKFEAINMVMHAEEANTSALARLFRVQSPTSGNQFAFGITKEGRVFCHIPKSLTGEPQDVGKSLDLNVSGLVKMIVGADQNSNNCSLDMRLQGGLSLDIGRFSDGKSVHLRMGGKVKTEYGGNDSEGLAHETIVGGSSMSVVSATNTHIVNGSDYELIGGSKVLETTGYSMNVGAGGFKGKVAGDNSITVLGKTSEQYAQKVTRTDALGRARTTVSGVDSSTVLVGSSSRTVVAGSGISDSVVTGNMSSSVVTGNMSFSVATGNLTATVGAGSLSLTSGGSASITSSANFSVVAPISSIQAPISSIGVAPIGGIVSGTPSVPGPHIDFIVGIPILGSPVHTIG